MLLATMALSVPAPLEAARFAAYSLNQAERQLKRGGADAALTDLGGITTPLGIVYDEARDDLVIVGYCGERDPKITLDDLVVPLRAVLKFGKVPLVSIDRTRETDITGKQAVRFDGSIQDTQFGKDLLDADVTLKRLGLGVLDASEWGIDSYFDASLTEWKKNGAESLVQCRFWFVPSTDSFTAVRQGVAVVKKARVDVRSEVTDPSVGAGMPLRATATRDTCGEAFATTLAAHLREVCDRHRELRRLDPLFRLAGLAEGLERLRQKYPTFRPNLDFWLNDYVIVRMETPRSFPLFVRSEVVRKGRVAKRMTVDGGIELRSLILELNDGDLGAFRDIVLRARPIGDSLIWSVPLEGWEMPDIPIRETVIPPSSPASISDPRIGSQLGSTLRKQFDDPARFDRLSRQLHELKSTQALQIQQPHFLDLIQQSQRSTALPAPSLPTASATLPDLQRTEVGAGQSLSGPAMSRVPISLGFMNSIASPSKISISMPSVPSPTTALPMAPHLTAAWSKLGTPDNLAFRAMNAGLPIVPTPQSSISLSSIPQTPTSPTVINRLMGQGGTSSGPYQPFLPNVPILTPTFQPVPNPLPAVSPYQPVYTPPVYNPGTHTQPTYSPPTPTPVYSPPIR